MSAPNNEPSVVLANPGLRLSFQIALGLQEAGLLKHYLTSFYYRRDNALGKLASILPSPIGPKLEHEFRRRYLEGLDADRILTSDFVELFWIASKRLGFSGALADGMLRWRCNTHAKRFARQIERIRPKAVVVCDGWAVNAFNACEKVGAHRILDQNTGHMTMGGLLMREEQELHPEFADTIITVSDEFMEDAREEALRAESVLVSSDYAKDSLVAIGVPADCIHKIPYASDNERFTPLPPEEREKMAGDPVTFLFVGTLTQRKGIKYLFEAFKRLKLPNCELKVVGSTIGEGRGLENYRDVFTHIPNVPHHEIDELFRRADVFVCPSLHESGVLAIHEALASGLPVITTPHAGSIVRDGKDGFIVPIRDIDALAEKIELLYRDRELRLTLGEQGRKRAEEFTWARYRQGLGKAVGEIVAQSG